VDNSSIDNPKTNKTNNKLKNTNIKKLHYVTVAPLEGYIESRIADDALYIVSDRVLLAARR